MDASRKWILAAACSLIGHNAALGGESIDRLGRLWGYGYSHGYHACGSDCYHVGDNLPPLSFTAQPSYYAAAHRMPTVRAHGGVPCDQNWSPALAPDWQDSSGQIPTNAPPSGGTVIQDRLLHETPRRTTLESIPLSPYSPSESAEPKPTPAKQPAPPKEPLNSGKQAPAPKPLPLDINGEPEELPPPHREPLSPSDNNDARSRYRRMNPASFSTPVARPTRLGASTPGWIPPGTK